MILSSAFTMARNAQYIFSPVIIRWLKKGSQNLERHSRWCVCVCVFLLFFTQLHTWIVLQEAKCPIEILHIWPQESGKGADCVRMQEVGGREFQRVESWRGGFHNLLWTCTSLGLTPGCAWMRQTPNHMTNMLRIGDI